MEIQNSLNLKNRTLWFDGAVSVNSDDIADRLLCGKSIDNFYVHEINSDVKKFNLMADKKLKVKYSAKVQPASFIIPEQYLNINLKKYLFCKLYERVKEDNFTEDDIERRIARIEQECTLFTQYNILDLIKTTIYIVDTFTKNNIVWGTGRGSSCACYSLYLIGLHEVDSVLYDLDLNEFFR